MLLPKCSLFTLAALLPSALAQVPASLSKGFNTQIQVSFQGNSAIGFSDGQKIPFPDTANQPVFALGDASGVNTAISFMIIMLDTTDESNFIMHYLQTGFKATGDKTGLSSSTSPMIPYSKPGAFSEAGEREYTFLLYLQKTGELTSMPQAGGRFDYVSFGTANNLEPPTAGIAMKVSVGEAAGGPLPAPPPPPPSSSFSSSSSTTAPAPTPPNGAAPAATTSTETMPMASEKPLSTSPTPPTNMTSTDGDLTMKPPPVVPVKAIGGGIVTEQPFPAPGAANGPAMVNSTAKILETGNEALTSANATNANPTAAAAAAALAVENEAGGAFVGVGMKAGASMAALVVMVAAVGFM